MPPKSPTVPYHHYPSFTYIFALLLYVINQHATFAHSGSSNNYRACLEVSRELRHLPCRCALGPAEPSPGGGVDVPAVSVDCDRVVFPGDAPVLPYGTPVVTFRQRNAGYQALPTQAFSQSGIALRSLDFSGNSLRRLSDRLLSGLQDSLLELRLADNLLGDTLNPIFSSSEFHGLRHLRLLDLSGNGIKSIEEGILEGCAELQELFLDRNSLLTIPGASLNGPRNLRILSVKENRIGTIKTGSFRTQPKLDIVDLSKNLISAIESGAFEGMDRLKSLKLGRNRLTKFNSDVFQGAESLQHLDLSENFISEFPTVALKTFTGLMYLNLSSNLIQSLDNNDLAGLVNLYHLDLSRNNIGNIVPGTFLGLRQLRRLDISINSLRTIEDDAFEGLDNLEHLSLKDNNILLIPASALGRLPRLTSLQLDYNRVAALSGDIFRSIADRVTSLVLSKNVVRELPSGTFQYFKHLQNLDLTRNLLTSLSPDVFQGLEHSLVTLQLAQNRLGSISGALNLQKLRDLDLSDNHLTELGRSTFAQLPELRKLNLSHNSHLGGPQHDFLHPLGQLKVIDLSYTGLKQLHSNYFTENLVLEQIYLHHNDISDIQDNAISNLRNLTVLDLSYNKISNIRQAAFVNVMNLKVFNLKGNQLTSFKGEHFNTGTGLEVLDISYNQLSYLFPSSFRIHPRLKQLYASHNKFNFFPAELIASLQFLELVDLSYNGLKTVEELDFARLPRLRTLLLSYNQIETLSEMAFHNSTQLQIIDLAYNRLERLGERTFEGLLRIDNLNLEGNQLTELPETIFERARVQMLENINLAGNKFVLAPLRSLQRQYFFVSSVDLSRNQLKDIPGDDSIMVNIKKLDLSFNPLSEEAVANILGEPKTVRELNLAGTGIEVVKRLETPFLSALNLSFNNISDLDSKTFERTTLLEDLDLSHNALEEIAQLAKIWGTLRNLQSLNISSNPIITVPSNAFDGLKSLRHLSLSDLEFCTRIEKAAFKTVPNLSDLEAYGYPKLGYLDLTGLLQHLPALERVNVETKDAAIGGDQLISVLHPRLKELGLHGSRLRSISSGTFSGLKGGDVTIRLMNTSLTALPPALFFPVPRSIKVDLDVTGSQLATLNPQLLVTLDDRRGDLRILGLETNPVICDCGARALRRWLPSHMTTVRCTAPEHLIGRLLVEIGDSELTCDPRKITTSAHARPDPDTSPSVPPTVKLMPPKTTEPEIIWSVPPSTSGKGAAVTPKQPPVGGQPQPNVVNNDDTLIIGIVGGVVAFIFILIIVICIIRLRMSGPPPSNSTILAGPPMGGGPGSSCATCSVKGGQTPVYAAGAVPPPYAASYASLPHKMAPGQVRQAYSTIGRMPYYQNGAQTPGMQPYFIAAYPSDEKIYR